MATKLLCLIFIFGNCLTLTPLFNQKVTLRRKIYSVIFVTSNIAISFLNWYNQSFYRGETFLKIVVRFMLDISLLVFTSYTVLAVTFFKRQQWRELMVCLQTIDSELNSIKIGRNVKIAITILAFKMAELAAVYFFWLKVYGMIYFQWCNVNYLQQYLSFAHNIFLCLILSLVLEKYKFLKNAILNMHQMISVNYFPFSLKKVEYSLCFLKDVVDTFYEIFGWSIFLDIFYITICVLNNLDYIFLSASKNNLLVFEKILADAGLTATHFIGRIFLILMCDSVLKEVEKIQTLAYKLKRLCVYSGWKKDELKQLCQLIFENFPKFTAAGFFTIQRSTIFKILNTVITFLIVSIQIRLQY